MFLLTFSKIFCLTNGYCLVVRYADKPVYCLGQCFSKWSIGTSNGLNGARQIKVRFYPCNKRQCQNSQKYKAVKVKTFF